MNITGSFGLAASASAAPQTLPSGRNPTYDQFFVRTNLNCRDRNIIRDILDFEIEPSEEETGETTGQNGDTEGPNVDPTGEDTQAERPPDEPTEYNPDPFAVNGQPIDLESVLRQINFGSSLGINQQQFTSIGRSLLVVNSSDFGATTSELNNFFTIEEPLLLDRIKYFYNSFYSLEDNNSLALYKNKTDKSYLLINRAQQQVASNNIGQDGLKFPIFRDTIYFYQDSGLTISENTPQYPNLSVQNVNLQNQIILNAFVQGTAYTGSINYQQKQNFLFKRLVADTLFGQEPIRFNDDTFIINLPFENTEILENLNLVGTSIVDIKTNYNFYIKEYEKIAISSNTNSNEKSFPNLYILMDFIAKNNNDSVALNTALTNGENLIQGPLGNPLYILNGIDRTLDVTRTSKILLGEKNPVGQYFDDFGRTYNSLKQENLDLFNTFENKNKNIIFLTDAINNLSVMNEKKNMFPMSVEIKIPTDKSSTITKMFYNSQLMDNFIVLVSDLYNSNSFVDKEIVYSEKIIQQNIQQQSVAGVQSINSTYASGRKNIKEYNLSDLFSTLMRQAIPEDDSHYFLIGDTNGNFERSPDLLGIINNLRRIIFQGQFTTFLKTNCRNYLDILSGKTSYSETVIYRIAKYSENQEEPIQNYWIPNNIDIDYLNVIDTQIKYEKNYTYKIYAYQIVVGTAYTQQENLTNLQNGLAGVDVTWQANPKLIEVEILSFDRRIIDSPPLSPEVEFVPYQNIDNKMGIFLNTRVGTEQAEIINILEQDINKTSLYKKDSNNLVTYKTDDLTRRFEIMKLDKKPKNYSDFRAGYIKTIQTEPDINNPNNTVASSFIDDIEPNKKYYYCFRSIDVHEHVSNPSPVYEIEIINENGMVYPIIKTYEFELPKFQNSLEMRRFIKLKPQLQHYLINSEDPTIADSSTASEAINNIKLGISNVGVPWDKPFKLVVTSKQTGRKIEIKFKFKYIVE